jgi:mRNA interferase RelE/StbE
MSYQLYIKPAAEREIDRLPRTLQRRIAAALSRVQTDPRGQGTVKLSGTKSTYRVRVGDWRIIYEIDDSAKSCLSQWWRIGAKSIADYEARLRRAPTLGELAPPVGAEDEVVEAQEADGKVGAGDGAVIHARNARQGDAGAQERG